MKRHVLMLEIEEINENNFNSNFSAMGNDHIIAQGIGAAMRRDSRFRGIVLEAIDNMVAGVDMEITPRKEEDILEQKKRKAD